MAWPWDEMGWVGGSNETRRPLTWPCLLAKVGLSRGRRGTNATAAGQISGHLTLVPYRAPDLISPNNKHHVRIGARVRVAFRNSRCNTDIPTCSLTILVFHRRHDRRCLIPSSRASISLQSDSTLAIVSIPIPCFWLRPTMARPSPPPQDNSSGIISSPSTPHPLPSEFPMPLFHSFVVMDPSCSRRAAKFA